MRALRTLLAGLALSGLLGGCATSEPLPAAEAPAAALASVPRVEAGDVWYLGAFRVPVLGTEDHEGLRFGGNALAYDAGRDSLFLIAHDWHQLTAEISIPQPRQAPSADELPRARLLQGPTDATGGRLGAISDPPNREQARIAGQLRVGDSLLLGAFHYYDSAGQQVASHFRRPRDLTTGPGSVRGPVRLGGPTPARWLGGYMTAVPPAWQAALGGAALTGLTGVPIAGNASNGPTLAVFDPRALIDPERQPRARLLVGYPLNAPLAPLEVRNPVWNFSSEIGGAAFVAGTRSVLFFGRHGTGPYCYGDGEQCRDPAKADQGTHGYPYEYRIWAYDAADLAAVARGERPPHSLEPYAVWPLSLPFERDDQHRIGGVAHDPATGRVFVTQREGDSDGKHPLVHVLRVGPPR